MRNVSLAHFQSPWGKSRSISPSFLGGVPLVGGMVRDVNFQPLGHFSKSWPCGCQPLPPDDWWSRVLRTSPQVSGSPQVDQKGTFSVGSFGVHLRRPSQGSRDHVQASSRSSVQVLQPVLGCCPGGSSKILELDIMLFSKE